MTLNPKWAKGQGAGLAPSLLPRSILQEQMAVRNISHPLLSF